MDSSDIIVQLEKFQSRLFKRVDNEVVPADPGTLSNNLLLIRGLLIQLIEHVAVNEREYRLAKSARFDKFLKDGMKKSPAMDQLEMEPDLIELKIATERIRNYAKYVDGLCTSIQSVLKVQSASDRNQY